MNLSENALKDICIQMGFKNVSSIEWRMQNDSNFSAENLTKVVIENPFMPLKINDFFTIDSYKPSKQFMRKVKFTDEDKANCQRFDIKCT